MFLPLSQADGRVNASGGLRALGEYQVPSLRTEKINQLRCEVVGQPGEVDALQTRTARTEWRVLVRQVRCECCPVVGRPNRVPQFGKRHVQAPADLVPVRARPTELQRFRRFVRVRA